MNGGRSDASTSTDDVKGRPLCLFYFTHPFGVLSPEPPTLAAAPPHIARAFLNMEPVSPFFWSTAASATATATATSDDLYQTSSESTALNYDIGNTTVHRDPVSVVSVTRTRARNCTVDFPSRRDSLSSSLFSSDIWFNSSCSSKSTEYPRRLVPYNRILPPLRLPSPRDLSDYSSDDVWPRKCLNPEKFSLPPIELPTSAVTEAGADARAGGGVRIALDEVSSASAASGGVREARRGARGRRLRLGVDKLRHQRHHTDVRRMLTCLIRRAIRGGEESGSPALQRVLHTIRDAWAEPTTLFERCRTLSRTYSHSIAPQRQTITERTTRAMLRAPLDEPPPRPDASPGLLRRRYSVPETIMRKYRLAQQRSDSEQSGAVTHASVASACASPPRETNCSPGDSPHRFMRRDRELMRKSALLRRMWARPCRAPACCCCAEEARETRSLDGSRSELRASSSSRCGPEQRAAPWASPKRQRLTATADHSDSTFQSHRADRNLTSADTPTDVFTDSEVSRFGYVPESCASPPSSQRLSEPATAEPESEERSPPDMDAREDRSFADSDTLSASVSTAKETNGSNDALPQGPLSSNGHIEGHFSESSAGVENDDRNVPQYDRQLAIETPAPPYELLEIVVSETVDAAIATIPPNKLHDEAVFTNGSALTNYRYGRNLNIDEYVSNILVESLNSLTDQLEYMNASIVGDRKISIVEKEIKVKLQNTGVNTIVHLSPTSNNQIIFGNEELCNERQSERDECNNPLTIREEREHSLESNNNLTSSAGSACRLRSPGASIETAFEPPLQNDNVNRAVLQQIQKLFRDELCSLDEGEYAADAPPGVSHVEISNVDVYLDAHRTEGVAPRGELEITTRVDGDLIGGVGAGNYFHNGNEAITVPRFSAFPHTESMEVNTSSSDDAEAVCSDCTSLVDSLDDPNSPRSVLLRRRGELTRSAVDVLELLPEGARTSADSRGEAFFIRIEDDERTQHEDNVKVAEYMPENIKQRLYRRHRKRELRMECARRSKVKQLKKELERRRHEELTRARREVERDCMAIVNALIDDVIAKIAQDEFKCMRIKHRNSKLTAAKSDENLSKRHRRKDLEALDYGEDDKCTKNGPSRRSSDKENRKSERHQIRGKLLARPSVTSSERPPRRVYQKSEIHEGEKCIEILEIIEYVNGSQSSPETTNSDECYNQSSKCKKSRIPIPVYERLQRTSKNDILQRLTGGGDGRRASPPPTGHTLADMLLQALVDEPQRALAPAPAPVQQEPRSRSNSLRFKRVFDIIPEERSSLSFDSSAEDAELARRAAACDVDVSTTTPSLLPAPAPDPIPVHIPAPVESPRRGKTVRSTGTSPLADEERARRLRSQTTMTSPCSKSAATSPLRPNAATATTAAQPTLRPPPPPPQRPAREGRREKVKEAVKSTTIISERGHERTNAAGHYGGGCPEENVDLALTRNRSRVPAATGRAIANGERIQSEEVAPTGTRTESQSCERRRGSLPGPGLRAGRVPSRSFDDGEVFREERTMRSGTRSGAGGSSSDSGDSGGSLLCSLAPRWLSAHTRQRRRVRRTAPPAPTAAPAPPPPLTDREQGSGPDRGAGAVGGGGAGGWSVTVAGSCRAALPADVEMRLRFPHDHPAATATAATANIPAHVTRADRYQECTCVQCAACAGSRAALPPAPPPPHIPPDSRLTLTMKKEAQDSSILASKSVRKSSAQLPELETYRASRTKLKSSVKTRRGYSLHCWLPDAEPAPIRSNNGLSVLGCAIIPELKPRVPTMSERDLTRVYTPRHYLRS